MPSWVIASVFGILALAAVYGIYRGLASGTTNDDVWTFQVDSNPIGYFATLAGKFFVLSFAAAMILNATGFSSFNPVKEMEKLLPFLANARP